MDGFGHHVSYHGHVTSDGGWEIDPDVLSRVCEQVIGKVCEQMRARNIRPAAVGFDTFWQHIMGVDADGKPVTPIIHVFDTRSAPEAEELARKIDNKQQHQRTGAVLHPSYVPSKLLWLAKTQPDAFHRAAKWMTFGEYFFLRIFGKAVTSTSMVSGLGFWDQNRNVYDDELMKVLPTEPGQFARPEDMDEPQTKLVDSYASQWPELQGIPWFPALGDGACDNAGSGCTTDNRFALMVGTSGAMRVVLEREPDGIPDGLFCYRLDRRRFVVGGALSNGGEVYAWCKRTLQLPQDEADLEKQIAGMAPGKHGLDIVPLFAGERSTKWRPEAKGAITGMEFSTTPLEILRAALESVALRFREVHEQMLACAGTPAEIVVSGGALLHSRSWVQMMADALNHQMVECLEPEATSRGAALMAMERIGAIRSIGDLAPKLGDTVLPIAENTAVYPGLLARQRAFYTKLFEEKW